MATTNKLATLLESTQLLWLPFTADPEFSITQLFMRSTTTQTSLVLAAITTHCHFRGSVEDKLLYH